jgi:hypothetical protein
VRQEGQVLRGFGGFQLAHPPLFHQMVLHRRRAAREFVEKAVVVADAGPGARADGVRGDGHRALRRAAHSVGGTLSVVSRDPVARSPPLPSPTEACAHAMAEAALDGLIDPLRRLPGLATIAHVWVDRRWLRWRLNRAFESLLPPVSEVAVMAVAVFKAGEAQGQTDVQLHCGGRIAGFKARGCVFIVDTWLKYPSGEPLKPQLRQVHADLSLGRHCVERPPALGGDSPASHRPSNAG